MAYVLSFNLTGCFSIFLFSIIRWNIFLLRLFHIILKIFIDGSLTINIIICHVHRIEYLNYSMTSMIVKHSTETIYDLFSRWILCFKSATCTRRARAFVIDPLQRRRCKRLHTGTTTRDNCPGWSNYFKLSENIMIDLLSDNIGKSLRQ